MRVLTFGLSRWRASFLSVFLSWVSKTQPNNPLHRYEFCPPKFFSKTFKFSIMFYSNWQISGGEPRRGQCRKALSPSPYPSILPSDTTSPVSSFPGYDHWEGLPLSIMGGGETYDRRAAAPTMFAFSFITTCNMLRQRTGLQHTPHPYLHHTSLPLSFRPHPPTHHFFESILALGYEFASS